MSDLARFECHKVVHAGKIISVNHVEGRGWAIVAEDADGNPATFNPPADIFARGRVAEPGDYLVRYEDGYLSWSPGGTFKSGYRRSD